MTATIPPTLTNNERLVLVKTTEVEDWVNILKKIEPKTKIIIEGKAMQFPFETSDEPLREYVGDYEQVNLEKGIQEKLIDYTEKFIKY